MTTESPNNSTDRRDRGIVLITGCQRSGTTLLHLILDSHPEIAGVDEGAYGFANSRFGIDDDGRITGRVRECLDQHSEHPRVSFKLPMQAAEVESFKGLPNLEVLWCLRDPRDVILSMTRLHLRLDRVKSVAWSIHSMGAENEIRRCHAALPLEVQHDLESVMIRFGELEARPVVERDEADGIFLAALCWRLKQEAFNLYRAAGVRVRVVRYESLVRQPRAEIAEVLQALELPWHDDVLRHHELHSGISIGKTSNTRPIDSGNVGKWKKKLSEHDLRTIYEVCAPALEAAGYDRASAAT